jgi:Lipopolysaccharide assembly protein A domain
MVERSPGDGTTTRRLTGGAIASLSGVGLLVIFMIQNTDDVKLDFLFWSFTWPLWLLCLVMAVWGRSRGSDWASCAVTGAVRSAARTGSS